MSHTPGPWRYENPKEHFAYVSADRYGGGDIATFWSDNAHDNAKLAAAAPELLAACKQILRDIKDAYDADETLVPNGTECQPILDAIEKATKP